MKIKILYSHLNVSGTDNKIRPTWFDFEKCFKSLVKNISYQPNGLSKQYEIEIHVIYDITKGGYGSNWIQKYWDYGINNIIFHQIEGGSMMKAAVEMYKIAKDLSGNMKDDDLFMFQENDYLYVNDIIDKVKELFEMYKLDGGYVSLYDHPDKYTPLYQDLVSKIIVTDSHHWRTTPSTCGSYVVNKKTFLEDYDVLTNVEGDHNKWLHLAENKGRYILSPIPSLSTHCMSQHLAPTINWEEINNG